MPVRDLIATENARRQSHPVLQSIAELTVDLDTEHALADRGLALASVPARGALLEVKNVCNQDSRRDQADVTAQVHADYHRFAGRVFEHLGAHLLGIDVMTTDISAPPLTSQATVLEFNIPAGLHYHELVTNAHDLSSVGAAIVEYTLAIEVDRQRRRVKAGCELSPRISGQPFRLDMENELHKLNADKGNG